MSKQTDRSIRGRQSRILGGYFESLIEASLAWYEEMGVACIEKTPEPMKPIGRPNNRGQFLACYVKLAQPDYKGTLSGGRSVVFEAKHTDSDRIERKATTQQQMDRLEMHYSLGGLAFVLVSFGLADFYRIPWPVWRDMKAKYGRQYIKQDELAKYKVAYRNGILHLLIDKPEK